MAVDVYLRTDRVVEEAEERFIRMTLVVEVAGRSNHSMLIREDMLGQAVRRLAHVLNVPPILTSTFPQRHRVELEQESIPSWGTGCQAFSASRLVESCSAL